jgi:GTP-binding protein
VSAAPRRGRERAPAGSTIATGQPVVAIVGYPNVGKSTLFNRIVGRRDAVVDSISGVTRDRRQSGADWRGIAFQLVDTGGIDASDESAMSRAVAAQAESAIGDADLVLFVVDVRTAPTPGDEDIAEQLRRSSAPVIVVANKCDDARHESAAASLWGLGLGPVVTVSAAHGRGSGELLDTLVETLPARGPEVGSEVLDRPAVCILGRPNVGKSSILNAVLAEQRAVVDSRPGTTRDPIDTLVDVDGREVVLIDTAGLRKRGKTREALERYSQVRALEAASRSDVALVVCDATEGITDTDLAAAEAAVKAGCATVLVVNKWDLAQPELLDLTERIERKTRQRPPLEVCSAESGEGVHRLLPAALRLYDRYREHIPTGALNRILRQLAEERPGPRKGHRRLSLRYLVQTGTQPPRFRLDVNDRDLLKRDYVVWLEGRLRRELEFEGVPLVLDIRERRR